MKHLDCDFCNNLTETKTVLLKKTRAGRNFTFETKAEVCPNCHAKYYDGAKLLQIEKSMKKQLATV
jgi:YgiT-type zinc finger domain-containing protein